MPKQPAPGATVTRIVAPGDLLLDVPVGLPGNTGRAGLISATFAPSTLSMAQPLRPKVRHDDLPKFASQRRADWWAELPSLVSDAVTLRGLRATDAGALVSVLGSPSVEAYISPGPATPDEARGFIDWTHRAREAGRYICFGIVPEGLTQPVGLFQIWPLEQSFRTAEWGFALGHRYWGSGLFMESARLVADFAFDDLGTARIEGRAAAENARGNAALRKLGAEPEGLLRRCFECTGGVVRDHILWALLDDDWRRVRPTLFR
ncbi:MAG: GNAT family N-acetyltransferase [Vicinamibacterales bacterium]|nr:GNAT family N-acetyltransferase [Vicinamibacterales bacterium]